MSFHVYWKSISHLFSALLFNVAVFLDLFAYLIYNVAILSNVALWTDPSQIVANSPIVKLENYSFSEIPWLSCPLNQYMNLRTAVSI